MKKITLSLAVMALVFIGCGGGTGGGTSYKAVDQTPSKSTTIYSGGGDVAVNDVTVDNGGTYIKNEDGTVTYSTGEGSGNIAIANGDGETSTPAGPTDDFPGEDASEQECTDAGYFYCPLQDACLDQPADNGACSSEEAKDIKVNII